MVFFCCNGCGDTLKKQKVEQHPCRSSYSCIDCNVNFSGNEYKKHTKCVSEAERYQGNLYQGKEDKGALKQNSWMICVREAAESCKNNSQLKGLLIRIAENDNVPRKKAKFLNFIKNSMRVGNKDLVEKAWDAIEKAGKPQAIPSVENNTAADNTQSNIANIENAVAENVTKSKKRKTVPESDNANGETKLKSDKPSKKRKRAECESQALTDKNEVSQEKKKKKKKLKNKENSATTENSTLLQPNLNLANGIAPETPGKAKKYKISGHIQELVFSKEEISLKKLKRKVTAAYLEYNPHKSPEEASRLFDKKVMKVPGVCVEHGVASKEVLDIAET